MDVEVSHGRQQSLGGNASEHSAYSLLRGHFQEVEDVGPENRPYDIHCYKLRTSPNYTGSGIGQQDDREPTVAQATFHFQIKSAPPGNGSPVIRSPNKATFSEWLDQAETEPVFIVAVRQLDAGHYIYWMRCIHDLLLEMGATEWRDTIPIRGFTQIQDDGANFHAKLYEEGLRATASPESKYRTLRDYGLLPVDERTFLQHLQLGRFLEFPKSVLDEMSKRGDLAMLRSIKIAIERLQSPEHLDGATSDPLLDDWFEEVRPFLPDLSTTYARKQFSQFVRFMNTPPDETELPEFHSSEVGMWRVFVSMYPASLDHLEKIALYSPEPARVRYAVALLPMLAQSNNRTTASRAKQVLHTAIQREHDFSSYGVRRELLRAPMEAGIDTIDRLQAHVREGAANGHEQRMLSSYGWVRAIIPNRIQRKLSTPSRRDEPLERHYLEMQEMFFFDNLWPVEF